MPTTPLCIHVLALRECTTYVPIGMVDLLRKAVVLAGVTAGRSIEVTLVSAARHGRSWAWAG